MCLISEFTEVLEYCFISRELSIINVIRSPKGSICDLLEFSVLLRNISAQENCWPQFLRSNHVQNTGKFELYCLPLGLPLQCEQGHFSVVTIT